MAASFRVSGMAVPRYVGWHDFGVDVCLSTTTNPLGPLQAGIKHALGKSIPQVRLWFTKGPIRPTFDYVEPARQGVVARGVAAGGLRVN
jgi:hypothetical protein